MTQLEMNVEEDKLVVSLQGINQEFTERSEMVDLSATSFVIYAIKKLHIFWAASICGTSQRGLIHINSLPMYYALIYTYTYISTSGLYK